MKSMQISLAPKYFRQPILPWTWGLQNATFGRIDIDPGIAPRPEVEQAMLDTVGSYGRQIGWRGKTSGYCCATRTGRRSARGKAEIAEIRARHGVAARGGTG